MATKANNKILNAAKREKKGEFYTQLEDIERELRHYKSQFKGKVVYCNCDDPRVSNFFHYFSYNFEKLGLKKLISSCYKSQEIDLFTTNISEKSIYLEYEGDKNNSHIPELDEIGIRHFDGDGDFRSQESIKLLQEADIVVTNPPFALFRDYVKQLVEHDKKFLIIGHQYAITYKEIFPLIKDNKIWLGYGFKRNMAHFISNYENDATDLDHKEGMIRVSGVQWFTNMDVTKRHEEVILYKTFNPIDYPKYDDFDAIEVARSQDIPMDYDGIMGVPITFLNKYNPEQFEIVGCLGAYAPDGYSLAGKIHVNGKKKFARIAIRNKKL